MRDAYRDDLAAAELRVHDLEREHVALVAQNAKLEAAAAPKPVNKPKFEATAGEKVFMVVVMGTFVVLYIMLGGPPGRHGPFGGLAALVALGAKGLVLLRRQALVPMTPVDHRLEAPSGPPLSEAETNQLRLAAAVQREQSETAARERAARDAAEVRELMKARAPEKSDTPRTFAMVFAVVGCIAAGAAGSLAGVALVVVAAAGIVAVVDRRKAA